MTEPARPIPIASSIAKFLFGAALFAALIWWVAPPWDEIRDRVHLSIPLLGISLLGSFVATVVTAARWKLLSEGMGASRLPYGVYFHWLALTRVVGQFMPTIVVDLLGRSAALRHAGSDTSMGHLMTPVVLERLLDLLLPFVMLAWAVAVRLELIGAPYLGLVLITALFALAMIPLLSPLVGLALRTYGWLRHFRHPDEPRPERPEVSRVLSAKIVGLAVARYFSILVQYWGAGAGFGVLLPALVLLSAAPVAQAAGLLGITPGGLGIQESGWVGGLKYLAQDEASIVVFMAATRLMMSVNFGLLSLASYPWRRATR